MSVRTPGVERARTIGVPPAFGGYAAAWILGQFLFLVIVSAADAMGAVDLVEGDPIPIPLLFIGTSVSWLVYIGMLSWLSRREGTGSFVDDYGLAVEWRDLAGLPIGVAAQLVLLPLVYWPLTELWPGTFNEDKLSENAEELVDRANGIGVPLLVVMVVLAAPVVEELVYRGLLQGALVRRIGRIAGLLVAAAFFALVHFRPVEYPGLFVAGLVFGACALVSGRLGPAIAAHIGFNAIGLLIAAG
jgi:membrane protease YdiL (CAAX protease family)